MQKSQGLLRLCASRSWFLDCPHSTVNGCYEPFNLATIAGSATDSHPADPPAMAVPETLCHPFATAKIVVWPATCSVRGGLIIAARSGEATLCACGRRGERTGNCCDRDRGGKCFPHSTPSCACMACTHATAAPSMMPRNSAVACPPSGGHCIRSTVGAGFELLVI